LKISVFVSEITDEFILGLDVLRAYGVLVDFGRHVLRLCREEVSLWSPGARQRSSRLILASDELIPSRCVRVMTTRLVTTLEAANGLVEPSLKTCRQGLYIARTLVLAGQKVPVRIVNVSNPDR
jgi:hypothetical protein